MAGKKQTNTADDSPSNLKAKDYSKKDDLNKMLNDFSSLRKGVSQQTSKVPNNDKISKEFDDKKDKTNKFESESIDKAKLSASHNDDFEYKGIPQKEKEAWKIMFE
jgi:hypothetical protein